MRKPLTVVGISDMHGTLLSTSCMPAGDVLCICGDIVPLEYQRDGLQSVAWLCSKFFPWIESLPYRKVFMIWGNHDFIGESLRVDRNGEYRKGSKVLKKLLAPSKLCLLDDSETQFEGYRFYGSSWCPDLRNWAFYANHDDLVEKFSRIPKGIDVLLTHCPPRIDTYGTVLQLGKFNTHEDYGCTELADAVRASKPKLHIFGHVHSGLHVPEEFDGTMLCNVSIKDESYDFYYVPETFTLS